MSDTRKDKEGYKGKKRPKHAQARFSCEMPRATKDALKEVALELDRSESWVMREAVNKFCKIHKYAKKGVE